jgi:hypothetical protein
MFAGTPKESSTVEIKSPAPEIGTFFAMRK